MLYRKIITCLSLSLTICCLTSGNARAIPCSNPSCENLGFIYTASQCGNHAALKCPFDSSKFFCDAQISVPKTCEESLIAAGLAPVTTQEEYRAAFAQGKEIVLMNSVYVEYEGYDDATDEWITLGEIHINNNIYTPAAIRNRFPLCPNVSNITFGSSGEGIIIDEKADGDLIYIYPNISDDTYGVTLNNPTAFRGEGSSYIDTLTVNNSSYSYFENGKYEINYSPDFAGTDITVGDNASLLFWGKPENLTMVNLYNFGCIKEEYSTSYQICTDKNSRDISSSSGDMFTFPAFGDLSWDDSFTTNCVSGTTPAHLNKPIDCKTVSSSYYNPIPLYIRPGNTDIDNKLSWCPANYAMDYISCPTGYEKISSSTYPHCDACQLILTDAKKQQCADEKTACYKSADTKRDKCVQKANIDRENCAYRASEAYDNCISMGGWWYDCDQTKSQAWDDCDHIYTYDDLDWCTTTHTNDYDDCDTSYDNCLEMPLAPMDDKIYCMKCP